MNSIQENQYLTLENKPSSQELIKDLYWNNNDNTNFYEQVNFLHLIEAAHKAGLASGCDILELKSYWQNAMSILEIGAGYGRVIDCLLRFGCKSKISAIERSDYFFEILSSKYKNRIELIHKSLSGNHGITVKYDLVLFLWTGIYEFHPLEQRNLIKTLTNFLNKNGNLIIDTMGENIIPQDVKYRQRMYKLTINSNSIRGYGVKHKEIKCYARSCGFKHVIHKPYVTQTGRRRAFHIIKGKNN